MREFYDINGDEPKVGDIIVYSTGSYLAKAYVLRFTKQGLYISCKQGNYYNSDLELHDDKKYKQWLSFMIIERNAVIPEILMSHRKIKR